ncbi:HAD family hydrolase [Ligilactobacillus ceti]|uniref:HAD superfamily hydrolase n=1 Tax=Ligilactobacillus ceti DSM 22408 TaxID=1122146 RepID=A0A0R2KHZ5_9LACO|nr:HAD family phosphatase [Ligilactobacillus ceti]KRN88978.1 HAD superfamily hydrolase [Ligilactobacillus ceti DSM 22408]
MEINLVIFDMDGVVIDSEQMYFKANQIAAKKLGMENYTLEYYQRFIGAGTSVMMNEMAKDYGSYELIEKFMELSFKHIHPIVDAGELDLKPGFLELSSYLKDNNIPYVVASSNDKKDIYYYLDSLQVRDGFLDILSAEDVVATKPAPDIFLAAWEKGGAPAKETTLVIEDSINGIKAANNAGIPVVMVPDLIQPSAEFADLDFTVCDDLHAVQKYISK